jgi:GT2 family glycosyltransferase
VDTPDRFRNLSIVLRFLYTGLKPVELLVIEHGVKSRCRNLAVQYGADYHFLESEGCFYKSRLLNYGVGVARHNTVLIHDADVLVHSEALKKSIEIVASGRADFVFPYNGAMLQIKEHMLDASFRADDAFLENAPFRVCGESVGDDPDFEYLYGNQDVPSAGGAIVGLRRSFFRFGGYNENIVSYGCEDVELMSRLDTLGADVYRIPDVNCYHLEHRRGNDSNYNNFHENNLAEWNKVRNMSARELWRYVHNGFRELVLDSNRVLIFDNTSETYSMTLAAPALQDAGDVDFILSFESADAPVEVIDRLHSALASGFENFRLHLIECNGDLHTELTHKTHATLRRWRSGARQDWLAFLMHHAEREILVFCSPDTAADVSVMTQAIQSARRKGIHEAEPFAVRRTRLKHRDDHDRIDGLPALKLRLTTPASNDTKA